MKLTYTTADGRLTAQFEASTQRELVEQLARFQEVFEDNNCRKFGEESDKVVWRVRVAEDSEGKKNKYYEKVCVDRSKPKLLGVKKAYGCHQEGGGLFPRVSTGKGDAKTWLPDNGWVKWNKDTGKEE